MITKQNHDRYRAHLNSLRKLADVEGCGAETVVSASLCYWAGEGRRSLPDGWTPAEGLERKPLQRFLEFLDDLSFDDAAFFISSAYTDLVEESYRKREAMFFTPPLLAQRLLDDCEAFGVRFDRDHICDPACGGSAFLLPAASRINEALKVAGAPPRQRLLHIQTHLTGIEKNPFLARLATAFLHLLLAEEITEAHIRPEFQIEANDTLSETDRWNGQFDVILCNPPYRKLSKDEKAALKEPYFSMLPGQPNLYALFMLRCLEFIKPGGQIAWITPSSFLSGTSFKNLRSLLRKECAVKQIGMVGSTTGVFRKVEQELTITHVAIAKPQMQTRVMRIDSEAQREQVAKVKLPDNGDVWAIPRTKETARALQKAEKFTWSLSAFGYVPRIGYCVHNRDTADRLEQLSAFRKSATAYPMIWAHHIVSGKHFVPEWGKGAPSVHVGIDYLSRDHPGILKRPAVLLQRVTSNDMKLRLVGSSLGQDFLNVYGGYVAENHVIALEQVDPSIGVSPELMVELLSHPIINQVLSCYSAASNITVYELSRLPMPNPKKLMLLVNAGYSVDKAIARMWQ